MESFSILLASLSAIALAIISRNLLHRKRRHRRKLPPGPKPWPIIGNLHLLGPARHRSFHALSQKYGEIMQLQLGSIPVVVASSPEMASQFFKVHDANFASRPLFSCGKYTAYNHSDLLWAPFGPHWKQGRKLYLTEVFSGNRLEFYEPIRAQERRSFLSRLCSLSGKPVFLREHLSCYTLSIMCRMALGDNCFASMTEQENSSFNLEELQQLINEWTLLNGSVNLGDWLPWLSFLDVQGCVKRMKELSEKFNRFNDYVIDDYLARRAVQKENIAPEDFVSSLLQQAGSLEVELTRDRIKGLVQDLLVGGTDSTVATIEWSILEVIRHPRVMEKAKEELERVIGRSRWAEESDIPQLPYINAIVMEAMRLHPVAALLPAHYAIEDCRVAGYDIAKGTVVIVNAHSLGRDPKSWDAAEEFLPERFMGKEVDLLGGNFVLLPFGSGRRSCPGYKQGLKTIGTAVANLLHGFELKLVEGMKAEDICVDESNGLVQHPKHPLPIIMKPTLPSHLY